MEKPPALSKTAIPPAMHPLRFARRSLIVSTLLLSFAAPARAQATRTVTRTVELAPDGHLVIDTYAGRVDVTPWNRPAVHVEVRLEADEEALVENTEIRFDASEDRLVISEEVNGEDGWLEELFSFGDGDHPATYYTVRMPRTARLTVDAYSSDIHVAAGLRSVLILDGYSSDITVDGLRGRLRADTYSGDVTAEHVHGAAEVDTYSGDTEIVFDELTGSSAFDTFSGDVTLFLPAGAGFDLEADLGMSGDLESAFASGELRGEEDEFRGPVQGGGPLIVFDTFSGNLELRTR